jgi:hypothetical protein
MLATFNHSYPSFVSSGGLLLSLISVPSIQKAGNGLPSRLGADANSTSIQIEIVALAFTIRKYES